MRATHRAMELSISEGEDSAISCDQPVSLTVGSRRHAHDRLIEMLTAHITEVVGRRPTEVTLTEDGATRIRHPRIAGVCETITIGGTLPHCYQVVFGADSVERSDDLKVARVVNRIGGVSCRSVRVWTS